MILWNLRHFLFKHLLQLHNHNSMFPIFASEIMDGWSPLVYSLPSSAFSKLIRKSVITRAGCCTWPLMTSRHHVIMSHDMSSSFTPTLITITILTKADPGRVNIWTSFRVQENFYLNILLICTLHICRVYFVSCSHAQYIYGRWAPVECDLCEGLSYWSSPFCLNVK